MTNAIEAVSIPRIGMFATVRNRRGIAASVEPFDGDTGRLHLVHLEYKDNQWEKVALTPREIELSGAFDAFRTKIRELIGGGHYRRRRAGSFAVEILGKRLLSCPTSFAESWRRCKEGLAEDRAAADTEVDAAAEGLNLQRLARYLLHFDCPWNPSRLEQRNGRLDRHGQARNVTIHHFVSDQDQDLRFLSHVIGKAHEIREDLGSANEIFDEAAHRRLVNGESVTAVQTDLNRRVVTSRGRAAMDTDDTAKTGEDGRDAGDRLRALAAEIDLDADALRDTLEAAMSIRAGRPQLDCETPDNTCKVLNPSLAGLKER